MVAQYNDVEFDLDNLESQLSAILDDDAAIKQLERFSATTQPHDSALREAVADWHNKREAHKLSRQFAKVAIAAYHQEVQDLRQTSFERDNIDIAHVVCVAMHDTAGVCQTLLANTTLPVNDQDNASFAPQLDGKTMALVAVSCARVLLDEYSVPHDIPPVIGHDLHEAAMTSQCTSVFYNVTEKVYSIVDMVNLVNAVCTETRRHCGVTKK